MARSPASRKYQLTINNPVAHGLTHECIKEIIIGFTGLEYWCMCDEVGKEGTPHTHVYVVSKNAIMFSTLQKRFYGAHIEPANGSNQENRDYIRKEGKWLISGYSSFGLPLAFCITKTLGVVDPGVVPFAS